MSGLDKEIASAGPYCKGEDGKQQRIYQWFGEKRRIRDRLRFQVVEKTHQIGIVNREFSRHHHVESNTDTPNLMRTPSRMYIGSVRVVRLLHRALRRVKVHCSFRVVQ